MCISDKASCKQIRMIFFSSRYVFIIQPCTVADDCGRRVAASGRIAYSKS